MIEEPSQPIRRRGSERKPLPSKEFLEECFTHDREKGVLIWKTRPLTHFPNAKAAAGWNGRFPGTEAGSRCCRPNGKHRYMDVGLKASANGEAYLYSVHLLIWLLLGNEVPENCEIDHKDNDPWNNHEDNLRVATPKQNQRNSAGHRKKKSGLLKWAFFEKDSKNGKIYGFRSAVRINDKTLFLGIFGTEREAHLTGLRKALEFHGDFVKCGCAPPCIP